MKVVYENLGQCVGERVVYIRSTDIEQKNWHRLLWSVPDEWFYRWSIGDSIVLHDITSNRSGGKVKRIFRPVFEDVLRWYLFSKPPVYRQFIHHYQKAREAVEADSSLKQRIVFWRHRIELMGLTVRAEVVDKEPNTIYQAIAQDAAKKAQSKSGLGVA